MSDNEKKSHRNPPERTRWKKGEPSPNPHGRPKGSPNRSKTLLKVFHELVDANIAGKRTRMPSAEATVRVLMQSALKGNLTAISQVMKFWIEAEAASEKSKVPEYPFSDGDRAVIAEIHERMKAAKFPGNA